MSFLKLRWRGILAASLVLAVLVALWAYSDEVKQRAQAVAELANVVQTLETTNETVDELRAERDAAEQTLQDHRERQMAARDLHMNTREVLRHEDHQAHRSRNLPSDVADWMHDNYGSGD